MATGQSIRASDRDRDAVIRVLGEQVGAGRLTLDELDERTDRALTARTTEELATLVVDLPGPPGLDGEPRSDEQARLGLPWCLVCLVPLALGLLAGAAGLAAPLATLAGLVAAAVLCGLTTKRESSR